MLSLDSLSHETGQGAIFQVSTLIALSVSVLRCGVDASKTVSFSSWSWLMLLN